MRKICFWGTNQEGTSILIDMKYSLPIAHFKENNTLPKAFTMKYQASFINFIDMNNTLKSRISNGFFESAEQARHFIEDKARSCGYRVLTERELNFQ